MKTETLIEELSRRNPSPETETTSELSRTDLDLLRTITGTPRPWSSGTRATGRVAASRHGGRVALAVAGVTAIAVTSVVVSGAFDGSSPLKGTSRPKTPVVAFLTDAAITAASQPIVPALGAGQYYYERNVISTIELCQLRPNGSGDPQLLAGVGQGDGPTFNYVQQTARQEWSTSINQGAIEVTPTDAGHFLTAAEQTLWERDGSPSLSGCATPFPPGLQPIAAPTNGAGGVGDLPTDASTLGSLIAAGRVNDVGQVSAGSGACPSKAGDAPQVYPPGAVCSVSAQFDIANNLLVAPEGPQIVGPALYQILAKLPGVKELGTQTDALGRSGTAIEDPSTGTVFVIDPTTGALLEQQDVALPSPTNGDFPAGAVRYSVTFGPLSVVDGLGIHPAP